MGAVLIAVLNTEKFSCAVSVYAQEFWGLFHMVQTRQLQTEAACSVVEGLSVL